MAKRSEAVEEKAEPVKVPAKPADAKSEPVEMPVTRREFDTLLARVNAISEHTGVGRK